MKLPIISIVVILLSQEFVICQLAKGYYAENSGNNNDTDMLEYVLLDDNNPCRRTCVKGAPPLTCKYKFELEWYETMSKACYDCPYVESDCSRQDCNPGDGYKRTIITVNRQLPGPKIEVCLGDEIIVDVMNHLRSESTTIHWHGQLQEGSPYMDGVPYVTQCPIQPGSTFRYHFRTNNAGTHFWHSHSGFQRGDGAFGAFIVRVPEEDDPHSREYDHDLSSHTIIVVDWDTETGLSKFISHHHNDGDNKPTDILVNGLGRFVLFNSSDNSTLFTPTAKFTVEQGFRYRFRMINAGFLNCPIEVSVDNHTLEIISTDGNDIETISADSLVTYAGERFDFIINANRTKGQYLMRFRGLMDCDERFKSAHQIAVLEYTGTENKTIIPVTTYAESHKEGLQVNPLNKGSESDNSSYITAPQLKSLKEWDATLERSPDFQYYIAYDFYRLNNPHYHKAPFYGFSNVSDPKKQVLTPQLNHITMKYPPFPVLTQRDEINEENMFCNETTMDRCGEDFCECTHVVKIALGSVVEMILIDEGFAYDANHPFHLHGNTFRVVAMERLGRNTTLKEVMQKDQKGEIRRNLKDAPVKDTVTVPDGGYTVIRFRATNPGYWLFHCHIEFHSEIGMAILFKIGEHNQMSPVPRNFPKCGDYLPDPRSDHIDCNYKYLNSSYAYKYCSGSRRSYTWSTMLIIILCVFLRFISR